MHQVALEIGSLRIHWYGVLVAAGFLAGLWTASRRALKAGVPAETVLDLGPWLIVGGILGARAWYVIAFWRQEFASQPWTEVFMIHHGGQVFYGGLIGGVAAGLIFIWRRKLPLWRVADVLAPSIALGQAFGRLGCLMNGCCYGRACTLPWAIHFPKDHETGGVGIHPTQIYEALFDASLYALLAVRFDRRKHDGQIFGLYLVLYSVGRSVIEMFRGDYAVRYLGWFTPAQVFSVVLLVAGGIILWRLRSKDSARADRPS